MSGFIINGKYYKEGANIEHFPVNSMYKSWHKDEQRRVHSADIIQAHKGGKPNGAFIRQYPEEAQRYFTPEQIKEYGNDY
jgi:hypothetical protein